MEALQAGVETLKEQVEELTRLLHDVRGHQLRRRLTNKRHEEKKQKKQVSRLILGTIPIPVRGVINDNAIKAKGFEAQFKRWTTWLQEEANKEDLDTGRFVRRVAADWNHSFEQLAATKSGGYFHLAIGPHQRLKCTDFELTGYTRKHTIPSRESELVDFRDRKVFNWARLYLCPVLEACSYLRDAKERVAKFWRTLALLGGGRFELMIHGTVWDFYHDNPPMVKLLRRVWPDLQGLLKAFADGLRVRNTKCGGKQ
jgi:hypothetical protein